MTGAHDDSLRYYRCALEICRSICYRAGEVYASQELGPVLIALGQVGQGIHILQGALVISQAVGEPRLECMLRVYLASSYARYVGNYPAAVQEAAAGLVLVGIVIVILVLTVLDLQALMILGR